MSKVLIITKNTSTYSHRQLLGAANDLGHDLDVMKTDNFALSSEPQSYDLVLHRDSGVSFDDVDLLLLRSFKPSSKRLLNSPEVTELLRGKDKQFLFFKENGLPHIPTAVFRRADQGLSFFKTDEDFILKTIRGNQGIGVMLVRGRDSLSSILESNEARQDQRYILQPKLDFIKEYRMLTLGDEIWGAIEKEPIGDFRANAKRCTPKLVEVIPPEVENLCEKILKILPEQFLGIDIGLTETGPKLIEINTTPGFETFDKLHDINSATRLFQELL